MQPTGSPSPRRLKPQREPPPLLTGIERMPGEAIIVEMDDDHGLLLWKAFQTVCLWAEASLEERRRLFADGAAERRGVLMDSLKFDPAVEGPLRTLGLILDNPSDLDPQPLSDACLALSEWAGARRGSGTALAFAQAAALTSPTSALAAVTVGRWARTRAEYGRAETWFREAIVRARRHADWHSYVLAHIGLGKTFKLRGALPAARRVMLRAYRAASRRSYHTLSGWALHDVATIAIAGGRWNEAAQHARGALEIFRSDPSLVARLVHDVAYAWISKGLFQPALEVIDRLDPSHFPPAEQLYLWGSKARAAGGAGNAAAFEEAWLRAVPLLRDPLAASGVAGTLLELARGAASLGDLGRAEGFAAEARMLAEKRGEAMTRMEAEAVLEAIRSEHLAERNAREAPSGTPLSVQRLVELFLSSLKTDAAASEEPAAAR